MGDGTDAGPCYGALVTTTSVNARDSIRGTADLAGEIGTPAGSGEGEVMRDMWLLARATAWA